MEIFLVKSSLNRAIGAEEPPVQLWVHQLRFEHAGRGKIAYSEDLKTHV